MTERRDSPPSEPTGPTYLPCPFCGKAPDPTDPSTLHPSGTIWRFQADIGCRTYHRFSERREGDGQCFVMNCLTEAGGCGANVSADTEAETVAAWNRRSPRSAIAPMVLSELEAKKIADAERCIMGLANREEGWDWEGVIDDLESLRAPRAVAAHTDHPPQQFRSNCPACVAEANMMAQQHRNSAPVALAPTVQLGATIKAAEAMANTGASAMHVIELFRALASEYAAVASMNARAQQEGK